MITKSQYKNLVPNETMIKYLSNGTVLQFKKLSKYVGSEFDERVFIEVNIPQFNFDDFSGKWSHNNNSIYWLPENCEIIEKKIKITAIMAQRLREKVGHGINDCKKALVETNGNIEKACEYIRTKGW